MQNKFSDNSNQSPNLKIQSKNFLKPLKNKPYPELSLKLHSQKEILHKNTLKNNSQKSKNIL